VPCGTGEHPVRWEGGTLRLLAHPEAEAELVLAALGGEKAGCVRVGDLWARHAADLSVLATGPRDATDQIVVDWDTMAAASAAPKFGWYAYAPLGGVPGAGDSDRHAELLTLYALGTRFQLRLAGQVAAAHAARPAATHRPALTTALTARLALAARDWAGIDPDQVSVTLHDHDGWGTLELTRSGAEARLHATLPAGWLASVWACGLTVVVGGHPRRYKGGHLVVAVVRPGWPDAQVLALRAPGSEPVLLDVHGTAGSGDAPHWEL
jgi:hypothetical protein